MSRELKGLKRTEGWSFVKKVEKIDKKNMIWIPPYWEKPLPGRPAKVSNYSIIIDYTHFYYLLFIILTTLLT